MKYYMAPMEGLTGYIYRNAYQKYFHDIDRYFTPFITNKKLDFKVKKDIDPEHNQGMEVVPQILTNQPDDFISIVKQLKQYGYDEVNLNLGCPSGTVVAKIEGLDFLRYRISWTVFWIKFLMHVTAKSPSKPESEKICRTSGRISLRFMRNIRYRS